MNLIKIKELINKKIEEHKTELKGCDLSKESIREELSTGKLDLQNNRQEAMLKAQSLLGLAQKSTFHSAAISVLNDLLEELDKA